MKRILFFVCSICCLSTAVAQVCPSGPIVLHSQQEVKNFGLNYPNCILFSGDLTISGPDIIDLSPLSSLKEVSGSLVIEGNTLLTTVSDLRHLEYAKQLIIKENPQLGNISLGNLKNIGDDGLRIHKNPNATTINLPLLSQVFGYFWIDFGGYLNTITCNNLSVVHGELALIWNPNLSTISFHSLSLIKLGLLIQRCYALNNLNTFSNVVEIKREILLLENIALTDISGLSNALVNNVKKIKISHNTSLSDCAIQSVCNILSNACNEIEIIDNTGNCATKNDVLTQCNVPAVHARVYLDSVDASTLLMMPYSAQTTGFPMMDPYSLAPLNTAFHHVYPGGLVTPALQTNSSVLAMTGGDAIVDWLFIELRLGNPGSTVVERTRAVLLQRDGDIVESDGSGQVHFPGLSSGDYYVCIRHRNHLGFRTLNTVHFNDCSLPALDFTNNSVAVYGATPLNLNAAGYYTMVGGDADSNGSVDALDTIIWEMENGLFDQYFQADYNMDDSVDAFDSIIWEMNNGKFQELD